MTQQQNDPTTPTATPAEDDKSLEDLLGVAKKAPSKKKESLEALVVRASKKPKKAGPAPADDKPKKTFGDILEKSMKKHTAKDAKKAAKAADKPAAKGKAPAKATKAAKAPVTKRKGNGEYGQNVAAAMGKIKSMKAGSILTTRELAEKHEIPPYAFLAAARQLEALDEVKLKNKDRINTITRL